MARSYADRHMTATCMTSTFLGSSLAVMFFGGCSSAPRADSATSRLAYNEEGVAPVEVEIAALPETNAAAQAEFTGPQSEQASAQTNVHVASTPTKATIADLAATYQADLVALRSMQTTPSAAPVVEAPPIAQPPIPIPPPIEWSDGTQGAAKDRLTTMRASAEQALLETATAAAKTAAKNSAKPVVAVMEAATTTQPQQTAVNAPLSAETIAIAPTSFPTDPAGIAARLASSLVAEATTSATPLRQLLALSALAVTDPSIALPQDLSTHLTETERAMAEKFHAAFVRLGRDLQEGKDDAALVSAVEQLLAAIKPQPILAMPRVELCTRVQAFGQIDPIGNRRFLAASSPKVIIYSELEHFMSALENAKWTTHLATKVSILTERDGVEVWRRSPEWTAVVDASDVKRDDFFVGEIVTLSPHLSVGSYVIKVTIRDEAT
ncbi:MAG: hypothetical protein EXS10_06195, partial [Phycisphaerales bacterium]|nr:hypothetical protein [Phycisphaerales bacterium]